MDCHTYSPNRHNILFCYIIYIMLSKYFQYLPQLRSINPKSSHKRQVIGNLIFEVIPPYVHAPVHWEQPQTTPYIFLAKCPGDRKAIQMANQDYALGN